MILFCHLTGAARIQAAEVDSFNSPVLPGSFLLHAVRGNEPGYKATITNCWCCLWVIEMWRWEGPWNVVCVCVLTLNYRIKNSHQLWHVWMQTEHSCFRCGLRHLPFFVACSQAHYGTCSQGDYVQCCRPLAFFVTCGQALLPWRPLPVKPVNCLNSWVVAIESYKKYAQWFTKFVPTLRFLLRPCSFQLVQNRNYTSRTTTATATRATAFQL